MEGSADRHFCWDVVGEKAVLGPDWVQKLTERVAEIREHMLAAQSIAKHINTL